MSKSIAIAGAPGAGCTSTAAALAALTAQQVETSVLLVFCDFVLPPKSYLCESQTAESLGGQLVEAGELPEGRLLRAVEPITDYFGVIGYNTGDHRTTFPPPTRGGAEKWCRAIATLADIVLYDVGSAVETALAAYLLEKADAVVTVMGADVKSAAWHKHIGKSLRSDLQVINNVRKGQPVDLFHDFANDSFVLPYSSELQEQLQTLQLFHTIEDRHYRTALEELHNRLK